MDATAAVDSRHAEGSRIVSPRVVVRCIQIRARYHVATPYAASGMSTTWVVFGRSYTAAGVHSIPSGEDWISSRSVAG